MVSPDVLMPRPETEAAVEIVLSLAGKPYLSGVKVPSSVLPSRPRILDVGTGSGCIATTLKLELPDAEVFACDISGKALEIAKKNAEKLGASIQFERSDLLQEYRGDGRERSAERKCDKFDVIVANLPYVDRSWPWISGVENEPDVALYAEDRGLEIIFKLMEQAYDMTQYLILEADPCQHERIIGYSNKYDLIRISGYQLLLKVK